MSTDIRSRLVGLAFAVLLLPLYLVFVHFGEEERGFVVFCVTGVACAAAYVQRRQPNRVRLWSLVALIYLIELPVALLIPLPAKLPGATMIPISLIDLVIFLGVISLFQSPKEVPQRCNED